MTGAPQTPSPGARTALASTDVVILAGGLGTRVRDVLADTPKVLAPVAGRPFLEHLLDQLAGFGARRVVLSLGHLAERVISHLGHHVRPEFDFVAIVEPEPLGTAGGLRYVRPWIQSELALVMNGDTFSDADLSAFVEAHRSSDAEASLLCLTTESTARFGRIDIAEDGHVERFCEKDSESDRPGLVNAGVYLFSKRFLDELWLHEGPSLERDVLERLPRGALRGVIDEAGTFIDIGTPDSLAEAEAFFVRLGGVEPRTAAA